MFPKDYLKSVGVPGIISAVSLLFAWVAIITLLQGSLKLSIVCAVLAFFFDSLDGYVARKMSKVSELGRQLDSMVDLVAYSVYSALLVHNQLLLGWEGVVVGYMIILFGILRLVRFNLAGYTETKSTRYYSGIVTCHLSLAAICFLLLLTFITVPSWIIAIVLLILAILQLSNIKTRKTGVLPFWYAVGAGLITGAIIWLP